MSINLKQWIGLSLAAFLLLIIINLALPALFLVLNVPSFSISFGAFWLLRWENTATGTSVQFDLTFLLAIAIVFALAVVLNKRLKRR